MKTFLDVYSDYGNIVAVSSEVAAGNMKAKNVLSQVPQLWKTTSNNVHTITGKLEFIDSADFVCPVDSYYVYVDYAPIGSIFKLEILPDLMQPASATYFFNNTLQEQALYSIGSTLTVGAYWKLTVTCPYASILKISRVMVGQAWLPGISVSGDITVAKNTFIKGERQRNGGMYIPPSINYRTNTVLYSELDKDDLFSLQDALSRYGTGATIFVEGLTSTSAFTFTSIYGRLIKWTQPEKSISGNYSISITVEETL